MNATQTAQTEPRPWTRFWDMNSGGGQKEKWEIIYVELPQTQAEIWFLNRFRHHPDRITCDCCGEDYVIQESETFEQAAGYHMGWHCDNRTNKYSYDGPPDPFGIRGNRRTVEAYKTDPTILVVPRDQIKDTELSDIDSAH